MAVMRINENMKVNHYQCTVLLFLMWQEGEKGGGGESAPPPLPPTPCFFNGGRGPFCVKNNFIVLPAFH